jgi:MarR family transcriptional regulator, lower aerobic nicotinate degradation pathway regulator
LVWPIICQIVGIVNVGAAHAIVRGVTGDGDRAEYDPPARITQLPSWLVGQLAAVAARLVADALARDGLRRQHYVVLSALAERGAASQAALGRRLSIDRSDMHALLDGLERDGLLARVRDAHDHRRILIDLTPAGARVLKRLEKRVDAAQAALLAPLSATDRRELNRLLTHLVDYHSGRTGR